MRATMLVCVMGFVLSLQSVARRADRLVGTWKLLSASASTATGTDEAPFGANPIGFLIYTPEAGCQQ